MVPRLAGVFALLFAATALFAQDAKKVKIEFQGEGTREVWIQGKGGSVPDRTSVSGKSVEIEAPSDTKDKTVYVHDVTTGNVATKPLDQVVKAGSWAVKAADETHTYTMVFTVAHDGKPLSAALVRLRAGSDERETLLTEKDQGMAAFFVVPFGDVEVTVEYESGGADKTLPAQVFESKKDMASAGPILLKIDDDVATVAPAKKEEGATKSTEKKKEEPPRSSPFATIVNMIIGLGVVGGIAYAIWRYVQANPEKAADLLQKGGVQVPGDPQDPGAAPKKAGPPAQIILGDAAPTPAAGPVISAGPVVKNPRLVKSDGSLYIVQDGDQVVGREGGQLTLAGESSVSRNHAKISNSGDTITLEDLGSTNGTFVNGQKVVGPTQLSPGDSVQFGSVQYRYEE